MPDTSFKWFGKLQEHSVLSLASNLSPCEFFFNNVVSVGLLWGRLLADPAWRQIWQYHCFRFSIFAHASRGYFIGIRSSLSMKPDVERLHYTVLYLCFCIQYREKYHHNQEREIVYQKPVLSLDGARSPFHHHSSSHHHLINSYIPIYTI